MQGLTWRLARALACESGTVEFASGERIKHELQRVTTSWQRIT
jgi:hypothetical protein